MKNISSNINRELFYYEKLKEIKHKKKSSPDFGNYKNSFSTNYGAHLINQKNIIKFDGAEAVEDYEQDVESMPNTVARGQEGGNYEQFNRLKNEAMKRAKKSKGATEKATKVAKAAKQLKSMKNIKNLYNLVKIAFTVDLVTVVVTLVIMFIQFFGGNVFKSKYIPPLGKIELLLFIPILLSASASTLVFVLPTIIGTGLLGSAYAGLANLIGNVGI